MQVLKRNNVRIIGNAEQTIIYGHGFGCNQEMWNLIIPAFEQTSTQILFDYVGSGQSDLAAFDAKRYSSIEGYAQDLIEVCEAVGATDNAIFVGHSVSCSAGITAAIKKPGLFKKMVLIGPTPCFLNKPPDYMGGFNAQDLMELLQLMEQNYLGWAQYLSEVVAGESSKDTVGKKLNNSFCSTNPETAKVFAKTTFFADDREAYGKVPIPCLILHHKHDSLVPTSVAEFMRKQIPNNVFKELAISGHCAHMSHPHLVIEEMRSFLS